MGLAQSGIERQRFLGRGTGLPDHLAHGSVGVYLPQDQAVGQADPRLGEPESVVTASRKLSIA